MAESMSPTPEELQQLQRSLNEKVLDRAASDPQWKQQLLDDPQAAMREANFPELKRVDEMRKSTWSSQEEGAEVRGHQWRWSDIVANRDDWVLAQDTPWQWYTYFYSCVGQ